MAKDQDEDQDNGPRETAAGLQRGDEDPSSHEHAGTSGGVNPATQKSMIDDRSNPDEQSTRAKNKRHGKVTADHWNQ